MVDVMTSRKVIAATTEAVAEFVDSQARDKAVGVAQLLQSKLVRAGDGDEICMDADVLFDFLDEQSRDLRDFIRFAREEAVVEDGA